MYYGHIYISERDVFTSILVHTRRLGKETQDTDSRGCSEPGNWGSESWAELEFLFTLHLFVLFGFCQTLQTSFLKVQNAGFN